MPTLVLGDASRSSDAKTMWSSQAQVSQGHEHGSLNDVPAESHDQDWGSDSDRPTSEPKAKTACQSFALFRFDDDENNAQTLSLSGISGKLLKLIQGDVIEVDDM
eukprot:192764-Rhodomonas_salina.1